MAFVFKSIEPANITVNPFYANKLWDVGAPGGYSLLNPALTYTSVASMSVYFGRQTTTTWNPAVTPEEQTSHGAYTRAVWASVNKLFYEGFSAAPQDHYAQGKDYLDTRVIGSTLQVWSIPQKIIGRGIQRGSLYVRQGAVTYTDDKNGNILNNSGVYSGNIIYNQGLIIWTAGPNITSNFLSTQAMTFRSTKLINSYEVICISGADEHNMSGNTSLLATDGTADTPTGAYNDDGECYAFVTGSSFSPYITSVGLYNDEGDLLAIAKMARPVKKAMNCDTIFVVRWDS